MDKERAWCFSCGFEINSSDFEHIKLETIAADKEFLIRFLQLFVNVLEPLPVSGCIKQIRIQNFSSALGYNEFLVFWLVRLEFLTQGLLGVDQSLDSFLACHINLIHD